MVIMKYNLRVFRHDINTNGRFEKSTYPIIAINEKLTAEQAKVTIAHELAHFFYQYEIDNEAHRISTRAANIHVEDKGALISEMVAHIVGHYGAEIQKLTTEIISQLWKD